jgi:phage minor structural protein
LITIYESNETNFNNLGLQVLQPTFAQPTCVANGLYELELDHPLDEEGRWKYIQELRIIKAPTPNGLQLFRIYRKVKTMSEITVYARHISYDLLDNMLLDVRPTNLTGQNALPYIFNRTLNPHNFTVSSDITTVNTAYYVRKNPIEALLGDDENSFIKRWGGEIFRDNFNLYMNNRVGSDNGVKIAYGKNLVALEEDMDMDSVVTRIIPVGFDGITLSGTTPYVDSPKINSYPHIIVREIKFDNIKVKNNPSDPDEEGYATLALAQAALIAASNQLFEDGIDIPQKYSYKADIVLLSQMEEYKDTPVFEDVSMGDTVVIQHENLGIDLEARVVKWVYDSIAERYASIELGSFNKDYIQSNNDILNKAEGILNQNGTVNTGMLQGIIDFVNVSMHAMADVAVKHKERAILFEDRDPDSDTFGCMCIGTKGFMISDTLNPEGTDWIFRTFGTGKGFIADLIVAGVILGNNIKIDLNTGEIEFNKGTISGLNLLLNLDEGTFNFADRLTFDGTTLSLTGDYTTYDADTGNKAIEITKRIQSFKDWDSSNECARIFSGKLIGEEDKRGLSIVGRSGKYISLGYEDTGGFQHAIFIDTGAYGNLGKVDIKKSTRFYDVVRIDGATDIYTQLTMHGDIQPSLDDVYDVGQWGMCWKGMYSFAFNQASDRAKKYNINELETDYSYDVIKNLKAYLYKYIPPVVTEDTTEEEKAKIAELQELNEKEFFAGVMADEVPIEMLNHDNEKSVNLYSYTTMLMGAMQEMMKKVERLENEVRRLGGDV